MPQHPFPDRKSILGLLKNDQQGTDIYSGKIALPEFQRNFVWRNADIRDLLVSVLNGFFVGTLLFLRRSTTFDFGLSYFQGVTDVNRGLPAQVNEGQVESATLDGQQRLTALFYVLYNPTKVSPKGTSYPYRYFLSIRDKLSGKDWDDSLWSISENDATKNLDVRMGSSIGKRSFREILRWANGYDALLAKNEFKTFCLETEFLPFKYLRSPVEFDRWLDEYVELHRTRRPAAYEEIVSRKRQMKDLFQHWFAFEVPVLTLEERKLVEVAEVFERINRTGVALSVFALATAVYVRRGFKIRQWWEESHRNPDFNFQNYCDVDDEYYPKFILQLVALRQGKEVKKAVLIDPDEMNLDRVKWDAASQALGGALARLEDCSTGYGVVRPADLPYTTIIVPLAGLLTDCDTGPKLRKLDAWYWSAVFTERYSGASDTAIKQDYDQVREWLGDDTKKPVVVAEADGAVGELPLRKTEKGALYKAIMNMTALKGAKDFFTRQAPTLSALNDHHIFPIKSGLSLTGENAILNRTLISETTNNRIKNKKPSEYILQMETELGSAEEVKSVLASHFVDDTALAAMRRDDYEAFLAAREAALKAEMKRRVTCS